MLRFEMTCEACPEQYDVFDGEELVGYVRLRGSRFRVFCPNVSGNVILETAIDDSGWTGAFDDEAQRGYYLTLAEIAIIRWLKQQKKEADVCI